MEKQQPLDDWGSMVTAWLPMVEHQLKAHAIQAAAGERGALMVRVTRKHMTAALATKQLPPGTKTRFEMDPTTFVPAESFLETMAKHHVDPSVADRWRPLLEAMNPATDVALFLVSASDGSDGGVFTRFIMLAELSQSAPR